MSFADHIGKQFGPRSGPTKGPVCHSGGIPERISRKLIFEKNQSMTKNIQNYPVGKELIFNPLPANRNKIRLLFSSAEIFKSLYGKQGGPRSDCSYRGSLFLVHAVCFYISYAMQLFAADDFSRR